MKNVKFECVNLMFSDRSVVPQSSRVIDQPRPQIWALNEWMGLFVCKVILESNHCAGRSNLVHFDLLIVLACCCTTPNTSEI